MLELRPYQERDVERLRQEMRRRNRALLYVAPTGSGKTVIFAHIAHRVAHKRKRVLILVHRQELLLQTSRALDAIGVRHGLIAPGHTATQDPVQVASVATLVRRLESAGHFDLLIIDECHHAVAGMWRKILDYFRRSFVLGVTATPERLDGRGLGVSAGGYFDTLVEGPSVAELTRLGYLSPAEVWTIPLSGAREPNRHRGGDFDAAELAEIWGARQLVGEPVAHYRHYCDDQPAMAFCVNIDIARRTAAAFHNAGIPAACIDGKLPDRDRKQRIDDLAAGRIQVLTSCEVISEGVDVPVVSAAILLRPTQSLALCMQQIGRALRPHPGKHVTTILDHAGNCLRHGLPDDERHWTLEGKKRSAKAALRAPNVRQCPDCYLTHTATLTHCPHCGYKYESRANGIDQVDGQLERLTSEDAAAIKDARAAARRRQRAKEERQCQSLDDWKALAASRGYKMGWAYRRFQLRQRKNAK